MLLPVASTKIKTAGIIVSLGSAVASLRPILSIGAYVAIYAADACFEADCYNCSHGMPNICTGRGYGINLDGAWASYVAVRAVCVVPVPSTPDKVPPAVVSTATDAVLTPWHAMKTCCHLQPEHTVLCLGIGGLGYNAVAIAKKCLGVKCVIACDVRDLALKTAQEAGADYVAKPEELARVIADNGLIVDFAFDFVGSQRTFDLCFASIRGGGTITVIGIGSPQLNVPPLLAMSKQLTYKATYYGTRNDLSEVLQAIAEGKLEPRAESRPMKDVVRVLEDLHAGKLSSRVALIPENW